MTVRSRKTAFAPAGGEPLSIPLTGVGAYCPLITPAGNRRSSVRRLSQRNVQSKQRVQYECPSFPSPWDSAPRFQRRTHKESITDKLYHNILCASTLLTWHIASHSVEYAISKNFFKEIYTEVILLYAMIVEV